ncbi:hypothetical protein [Fortiea contorta]|uniref:hypothetical protein n=1 Tax=Fortiea contorta TaxID=1892405 RepID=UPI00034B81D6|nr:hypothetical protein [Fortiea contorta]
MSKQPVNLNLSVLGSCEAEVKDAINSSFEPLPQPDPEPVEDSIYNFNLILNAEGEG